MNAETMEKQPHIGEILRAAREDAALTHAEVASELRIQVPFLEAIENLNTQALPSIG